MRELAGRAAVVTGAASGIGLAMCERFAAAGMNLVMADINESALAEAAERLSQSAAVETLTAVVDVSKWESVENLASLAYERFGAVHVLCNNAGVLAPSMPAWELSLEDWDWVLGIDLWGVIHGVKAFLPRMLDGGQPGHIVNTASVAGVLPYPYSASYSVAKYGVVALSESLILGLRDRGAPIGVTALCPGPVSTGLRNSSADMRPAGPEGFNLSLNADAAAPAETANAVLDAITRDRFWVFPSQDYHRVAARSHGIIETDEIVAPPSGAFSSRSRP
jgi:NAD(P)-dependent dehydrogenase (short-subunit alcohol dehydrogenase family)